MSTKPISIKELSEKHPDKHFIIITDPGEILRAADCQNGGAVKNEGGWVCLCCSPPAIGGKKVTTFICTEESWDAANSKTPACVSWAF